MWRQVLRVDIYLVGQISLKISFQNLPDPDDQTDAVSRPRFSDHRMLDVATTKGHSNEVSRRQVAI